MQKILCLFGVVLLLAGFACNRQQSSATVFPQKQIKIVVYTGPGGLIDITARKFTDIAAKYTRATFVVENKPGAGGIVALKQVLQAPADGYTLYACTKSNISKIVATRGESYIDALNWAAMLMADPECIITNKNLAISRWQQVVADARKRPGQQLWLGPAIGGLDHVMALKVWDKYSISGKWIPFKSGGKAKAALLGGQGIAYVGNPGEVSGNPDLQVAVVSANKRLAQFPDTPTFAELGIQGLNNEFMWRGFAFKKGIDPQILQWYDNLFAKVTNDAKWRKFWEKNSIQVVYYPSNKFTNIVEKDRREFTYYLRKIGISQGENAGIITKLTSGNGIIGVATVLLLGLIIVGFAFYRRRRDDFAQLMLPLSFSAMALLFLLMTFAFPTGEKVGPAVVPRLWIAILLPLNLYLLISIIRGTKEPTADGDRIDVVIVFISMLILYMLAIHFLGYFFSSALFVFSGMYVLGYRKYPIMLATTIGWLLFSYVTFYRLLHVPLPIGKLVEILF